MNALLWIVVESSKLKVESSNSIVTPTINLEQSTIFLTLNNQ